MLAQATRSMLTIFLLLSFAFGWLWLSALLAFFISCTFTIGTKIFKYPLFLISIAIWSSVNEKGGTKEQIRGW